MQLNGNNDDTKYSLKNDQRFESTPVSALIQHCKIHKMSIISRLLYWFYFMGVILSALCLWARIDVYTMYDTSSCSHTQQLYYVHKWLSELKLLVNSLLYKGREQIPQHKVGIYHYSNVWLF